MTYPTAKYAYNLGAIQALEDLTKTGGLPFLKSTPRDLAEIAAFTVGEDYLFHGKKHRKERIIGSTLGGMAGWEAGLHMEPHIMKMLSRVVKKEGPLGELLPILIPGLMSAGGAAAGAHIATQGK